MFHCHDGKADCSDVLYIFSVRMSVYHVVVMEGFQDILTKKALILLSHFKFMRVHCLRITSFPSSGQRGLMP